MIQYVDYAYYLESFHGERLTDSDFQSSVLPASAFIREITQNRIDQDHISDDVKDATCAVCEVLQEESERIQNSAYGVKEVKSENTDGYSVSFVTEQNEGESRESVMWKKKYAAARTYLIHTGLLYLGVE